MTRTEITALNAEPGDRLVITNDAGYRNESIVLAADDQRIQMATVADQHGRLDTVRRWYKRTSPRCSRTSWASGSAPGRPVTPREPPPHHHPKEHRAHLHRRLRRPGDG